MITKAPHAKLVQPYDIFVKSALKNKVITTEISVAGISVSDVLGGGFFDEKHRIPSPLRYCFKLVNLTIMTDEEINTHSYASVLEWPLKDAFIPGDTLCATAIPPAA